MSKILFCKTCEKYTLKKKCPSCDSATVTPEPAKFSPKDKYGEYRRKYKKGGDLSQ